MINKAYGGFKQECRIGVQIWRRKSLRIGSQGSRAATPVLTTHLLGSPTRKAQIRGEKIKKAHFLVRFGHHGDHATTRNTSHPPVWPRTSPLTHQSCCGASCLEDHARPFVVVGQLKPAQTSSAGRKGADAKPVAEGGSVAMANRQGQHNAHRPASL